MIEFTPLQLVGMVTILLSSGILIGAVIGYHACASENGEDDE